MYFILKKKFDDDKKFYLYDNILCQIEILLHNIEIIV